MPLTLEEYVESLTDEQRMQILSDYEEYRISGVIGDEPLRLYTNAFVEQAGMPNPSILITMELMGATCHRHYSLLYINEHMPEI